MSPWEPSKAQGELLKNIFLRGDNSVEIDWVKKGGVTS